MPDVEFDRLLTGIDRLARQATSEAFNNPMVEFQLNGLPPAGVVGRDRFKVFRNRYPETGQNVWNTLEETGVDETQVRKLFNHSKAFPAVYSDTGFYWNFSDNRFQVEKEYWQEIKDDQSRDARTIGMGFEMVKYYTFRAPLTRVLETRKWVGDAIRTLKYEANEAYDNHFADQLGPLFEQLLEDGRVGFHAKGAAIFMFDQENPQRLWFVFNKSLEDHLLYHFAREAQVKFLDKLQKEGEVVVKPHHKIGLLDTKPIDEIRRKVVRDMRQDYGLYGPALFSRFMDSTIPEYIQKHQLK
jgi:hypothetical protein